MVEQRSKLLVPSESKRSDHYVDTYANNTKLSLTLVDFSITFGRVVESSGSAAIEDDVLVRMSPRAFKVFLANASAMLKGWEAQCGEVSLEGMHTPPDEIARKLQEGLEKKRL